MRRVIFLFGLFVLFSHVSLLHAQDAADETAIARTGVQILWPPPVTEVWGTGDVIGTASVPGMAYYYLEYLPLNADLSLPQNAPWLPVTIAISQPVINGTLATLDTTIVEDGLYALRLVVNTVDGQTFTDVVSPVRVSNERFTNVTERIVEQTLAALEAAGILVPTPQPTPEPPAPPPGPPLAFPNAGLTAANVRYCDMVDNDRCPVTGSLGLNGAVVLALSSNGTGWYQLRLESGLVGWVSPTVVTIVGDQSTLPRIAPPAPLPPPPPPGIVVPTGIAISGATVCNQQFAVNVNVANTGAATSQPGSVTLQDVNIRTGEITFSDTGSFPALSPGANFVVTIPVLVSAYYNESHRLTAYAGGQSITVDYTLAQGNCGVQPTPPPPPPNPGRDFGPNQCFLVLTNAKVVFDTPYGNPQGTLEPAAYNALRVEVINQVNWYLLNLTDRPPAWIDGSGVEKQGNCSP